MSKNPKNRWKYDGENLHIFWTIWGISMKFSGEMWLMIILKVTKNQGFTLSLEDAFLGKPQVGHTDIVFKLNIFNLRMFSRTLDKKCSFVCLNFTLFRIIRIACFYCVFCFFRFIQFVLVYNKKTKEQSIVYRSK